MALTDPHCTTGTKIETKAVNVTSLDECLKRYGANKKIIILIVTVLKGLKLRQRRLNWVGAGLFLLQNPTLVDDT